MSHLEIQIEIDKTELHIASWNLPDFQPSWKSNILDNSNLVRQIKLGWDKVLPDQKFHFSDCDLIWSDLTWLEILLKTLIFGPDILQKQILRFAEKMECCKNSMYKSFCAPKYFNQKTKVYSA